MCGIYGSFSFDGQPTDSPRLARMGQLIRHRGPDDEGSYLSGHIALGMRRLSIIDLGGGHQPIANEDGTVWVVCNGEIYNFQELRAELQLKGHVFACKSDTEVLVHLYEEEGIDFVRRLRGMFAIALWDARQERLILARDRIGKKPLYVYRSRQRLLFASEVKAILPELPASPSINPDALREYLALGYVPAPKTLFAGIEKLLPGHLLTITAEAVEDRPYWDVSFGQVEQRTEAEWTEQLQEKILEAIRIRLVSDVPLGAFLSGGLDSSTIIAGMARLTGQPVKTYSIGFAGEDSFYNELPYAAIVAKAFGTDHHELIVRPQVAELLPALVWYLDEPIADSALITTYLVAKLARESVTVILSGVGGDELFGGYPRYLGGNLAAYYRRIPAMLRRRVLPALLSRLPNDRHSWLKSRVRYASAFVQSGDLPPADRYGSYLQVFSEPVIDALLRPSANGHTDGLGCISRYFAEADGADELNRIIYVDLKTSLADDLLSLTDKMTMAASIECRAPLVDQELLEFTAHMPGNLKVRGLTLKYLMKKAVAPWLPPQIVNRKKRGFGAPVGAWFRKDLAALIEDTLSERQVRERGFLDPNTVRQIIEQHNREQADYTDGLFGLVMLELWCRTFLDGVSLRVNQRAPMLECIALTGDAAGMENGFRRAGQ